MRTRPALSCLVAAAGLAGGAFAPAYADDAPPTTVITIESVTPGHVTGTASTDQPWARAYIADGAATVAWGSSLQQVADGNVPFDIATWGLRTDRTYTVRLVTCADGTGTGCRTTDAEFTPLDVDPQVTWSADRVIGPDDAVPTVTVADPDGGGRLEAFWGSGQSRSLSPGGANPLPGLPEGATEVGIRRCNGYVCRPTGQTAQFLIDRVFEPVAFGTVPQAIHPDDGSAPDVIVGFRVEGSDDYTVDWHLISETTGATVTGSDATVTGLTADAGIARIPVDLTGFPDGGYRLVGAFSYDAADGRHVTAAISHRLPRIDTSAPTIKSSTIDKPIVYPVPDHYLDKVTFAFRADEKTAPRFEVLDSTGQVVWKDDRLGGFAYENSTTWRGLNDEEEQLPPGTYRVRVLAADAAGNATVGTLGSVRVSLKKLTSVRVTRGVTAGASLAGSWTGSCAAITKEGSRRWSGGLGLVADARCTGNTWKRSGAVTVHSVRVPAGWISGEVTVSGYGGAATSRPRSRAVMELWGVNRSWRAQRILGAKVGWRGSGGVPRAVLALPHGRVYWRVATALDNRYDLKSFRVVFTGRALR